MAQRQATSEHAAEAPGARCPREAECHCPFLNRADERCSTHFRLDRLEQAFGHCFDRYHACDVYCELLRERRSRRTAASAALQVRSAMSAGDGGFDPAADAGSDWERQLSRQLSSYVPVERAAHATSPLVQLTVTRRSHRSVAQRQPAAQRQPGAQRHRTRPHAHAVPPAAGAGVPAAPRV